MTSPIRQSTLLAFFLVLSSIKKLSAFIIPQNILSSNVFNNIKTHFATNIDTTITASDNCHDIIYQIKSIVSAGLTKKELDTISSILSKACNSLNDEMMEDTGIFTFDFQNENCIPYVNKPAISNKIPGCTGRIVLFTTSIINNEMDNDEFYDDGEWLLALQYKISEYMDPILYNNDDESLNQPVLLCYRNHDDDVITLLNSKTDEKSIIDILAFLIEEEVEEYELCQPLLQLQNNYNKERFVPSSWVEIDGAVVEYDDKEWFDTSTIMVFDDLVDDELRQGLLNVILGKDCNTVEWDDIENGPDPKRWVYGGLCDVPTDDEDDTSSNSRGLSTDAIIDLCYNDHTPIKELESLLTKLFSKDITVTRLPEAVLGSSVSPITANAPTRNEAFDYHIDADPNLCPPSIWTDIYSTYPNRTPGKPRFMSFLIYLNDHWIDEFGAPTKFIDPVTKDVFEVMPKPGRCVLMDQDVLHTVTAPTEIAGKRPRYSIVWKLVLHPTKMNQDMKYGILSLNDDCNERRSYEFPKPTFIGSAASASFVK